MGGLDFMSLFLLLFLAAHGNCQGDPCSPSTCGFNGPEIRFPFRLTEQPLQCGYPGFELSCINNHTLLFNLPFHAGNASISSISYRSQRVTLSVNNPCLFLYLNFSGSPFYYSHQGNYTALDCSNSPDFDSQILKSLGYIPCLNGSTQKVLLVDPQHDMDDLMYLNRMDISWEAMNILTIIPRLYPIPRFYFVTVGFELGWDMPKCIDCERGGGRCGFNSNNTREIGCFHIKAGGSKRVIIICAILSLLAVSFPVLAVIRYFLGSDRKERENELKVEKFLEDYKTCKPTRYSYADLKRITDNFKEKLGQGGYGSVFKGNLPNGIPVAVKLLKKTGGDGDEFTNEVATIGRIHHVNVVRLLGFCADSFKRALIYEYMPNDSLEKLILSENPTQHHPLLGWEKLHEIAIGIARGIEYLHQGCDQRILHFDIKPQNILLDHNFTPKISDFGLAKLFSKGQSIVSMSAARGTMGYIAPEVLSRNFGNVSVKSDVYSFGMLLMEMVGGRKNIDTNVERTSQVYFPEWIYNCLEEGREIGVEIGASEDGGIAKKLTVVALWCIQWYPMDRPSMKSVVQMLEGSTESLMMPPNPFDSTAPNNQTVPKANHSIQLSVISESDE